MIAHAPYQFIIMLAHAPHRLLLLVLFATTGTINTSISGTFVVVVVADVVIIVVVIAAYSICNNILVGPQDTLNC